MASTDNRPMVTMDALAEALALAELAIANDPEVAALMCDPDVEVRKQVRRLALTNLVASEAFEAYGACPWESDYPRPTHRLSADDVGRIIDCGMADAVALYFRPWRHQ